MPRGVYDRSKMKNPAKKSDTAAPAPKRAYKRKTAVGESGVKAHGGDELKAAVPLLEQGKAEVIGGVSNRHGDIYRIRENLSALTNTRATLLGPTPTDPYTSPSKTSPVGEIVTKIDTLIGKLISQFDVTLFPVEKVEVAEEVIAAPAPSAPKNGAVTPAPVAVAPVPFNPPAFTQPQS